jgi:hypothetical protein
MRIGTATNRRRTPLQTYSGLFGAAQGMRHTGRFGAK